jgi:hypothetical protein
MKPFPDIDARTVTVPVRRRWRSDAGAGRAESATIPMDIPVIRRRLTAFQIRPNIHVDPDSWPPTEIMVKLGSPLAYDTRSGAHSIERCGAQAAHRARNKKLVRAQEAMRVGCAVTDSSGCADDPRQLAQPGAPAPKVAHDGRT